MAAANYDCPIASRYKRMIDKPNRRRFRFGLRSLFIVVTLVAIWAAYSANWIRQRREFVRKTVSDPFHFSIAQFDSAFSAPGLLWLFGESGVESIVLQSPTESDFAEARRLFPEAQIATVPEWIWKANTSTVAKPDRSDRL